MEDDDEKVRRNLVVFSSLILASAWLGHPELWLATQLLTPDSARPPAWKVTALALAVLVYLAARYWFSPAHETARNTMNHDWSRIKTRIRQRILVRGVENFHKTRKQLAFITTNMDEYVRDEVVDWDEPHDEEFELRFGSVHIQQRSEWDGELQTTRYITGHKRSGTVSGGSALPYEFPPGMRRSIRLRAAIYQLFYSRTAVEYFTPVALSVFAFAVLAYRLANV